MNWLYTTVLLVPALALGQTLNLDFAAIAAKASQKAEINLDEGMLQAALPLATGKVPQLAGKLNGLKSVAVRHYEFAAANTVSGSDLAGLRQQVAADKAWSRIISVKEKNQDVEVLVKTDGAGKIGEFLVIANEPKELTVVHVMGTIDLAQLREVVSSKIAFGGTPAPVQ